MTLLRPGETCTTVAHAERAGLLVDAARYYRALYAVLSQAREQVLMAGWQFDSRARMLRGDDARGVGDPVELVSFLDRLCRSRPALHVHLLSWKPNLAYVFERELFQRARFTWGRCDRLQYVWDEVHPVGGAHHQKLVVVDGRIAFAGGMDVCADRWDERSHHAENGERRDPKGKAFGPYHDVQAFVTGEAAEALHGIFRDRWQDATGEVLPLPRRDAQKALPFEPTIEFPGGPVGISRTRGAMAAPSRAPVREVRDLFVEAIAGAQRLLYVENQYFTSDAIQQALEERLRDAGRPPLDLVVVLPRRAEALKETIALGARQHSFIQALRRAAGEHGHRIGVYSPLSDDGRTQTYVHSKVLVVDDRVLSVGSSNLTNRSMKFDSELNLTWEAAGHDATAAAIRRARVELLAEHCGVLDDPEARRALEEPEGLVDRLEEIRRGTCRLVPFEADLPWITEVIPEDLGLDPEGAEVEEALQDTVRPIRRITRVVRSLRRAARR